MRIRLTYDGEIDIEVCLPVIISERSLDARTKSQAGYLSEEIHLSTTY
jgi:hypothetical protein